MQGYGLVKLQVFFSVEIAGKKQWRLVRKMTEIRKNLIREVLTKFFWKFFAKSTNFEVPSLSLGIFDEVLNEVSVSKVTVSTTSLLFSVANAKT